MRRVAEAAERAVRWFDDKQQDRPWLAYPTGVVRKYADDRGSALAALVTYQVFLGMLPLLVVVLTVLSQVLEGSADLRQAALESTLAQFPVVGDRIRNDVSALAASDAVLAIAVPALLWTAWGIYHGMQLALNQVWNVEGVDRQGFLSRHVRGLVLFTLVIGAALGTAPVRGWEIASWVPDAVAFALSTVLSAVVAAVVLLGVLRIVVSPAVPWRDLVPAAMAAAVLWEALQQLGPRLVVDRLARADDLYGALGVVVVALFWINLLARAIILANEGAVVAQRRLWPRRVAQPPLTDADRRVLEALMRNERRRPEMRAHIDFDDEADQVDGNPAQ
ncbi:MAG: YihY/virulence factor BrkB family protein [Actinobacteria bacterium]|nr:YihY/virulence factor BrkB family protein [Actinomycetota bacterium]